MPNSLKTTKQISISKTHHKWVGHDEHYFMLSSVNCLFVAKDGLSVLGHICNKKQVSTSVQLD